MNIHLMCTFGQLVPSLFVQARNCPFLQLPPQVVLPGVWAQTDPPLGSKPCQPGAGKKAPELAAKRPKVPSGWAGAGTQGPLCSLLAPATQSCACEALGLFCLLLAGGSWDLGGGPGRQLRTRGKGAVFKIERLSALVSPKGLLLNETLLHPPSPVWPVPWTGLWLFQSRETGLTRFC